MTAPADPRLGVASGRVDRRPVEHLAGQVRPDQQRDRSSRTTSPGANRKNWWQGVDFNVNARLRRPHAARRRRALDRRRRLVHVHRERLLRHRHPRRAEPAQLQHDHADRRRSSRGSAATRFRRSTCRWPARSRAVPGRRRWRTCSTPPPRSRGRWDVLPSGPRPQTITVNLFETNEAFYESIGTLDLRIAKTGALSGACAPTSASTSTTR